MKEIIFFARIEYFSSLIVTHVSRSSIHTSRRSVMWLLSFFQKGDIVEVDQRRLQFLSLRRRPLLVKRSALRFEGWKATVQTGRIRDDSWRTYSIRRAHQSQGANIPECRLILRRSEFLKCNQYICHFLVRSANLWPSLCFVCEILHKRSMSHSIQTKRPCCRLTVCCPAQWSLPGASSIFALYGTLSILCLHGMRRWEFDVCCWTSDHFGVSPSSWGPDDGLSPPQSWPLTLGTHFYWIFVCYEWWNHFASISCRSFISFFSPFVVCYQLKLGHKRLMGPKINTLL